MEPHPTQPSIEDQLAELRATVANLHAKILDRHTETYEIIGRLADTDERVQRSIDGLRTELGSLRDKLNMLTQFAGSTHELLGTMIQANEIVEKQVMQMSKVPKRRGILCCFWDVFTN